MKEAISPKDFAEAIGVSESSVKRWVDQGLLTANRTAGGHRRIARDEALRWLRENETPVLRPAKLGLPDAAASIERSTPLAEAAERFFSDLTEGRDTEAIGVLTGLYLAGRGAAVIGDEVVRPAMMRIGTLWKHSEEGIFVEHRATAICIQAVEALRALMPDADAVKAGQGARHPALVAVGGAPPGDPYLLAPMLATIALSEAGLHSVNLGPETPLAVLELAAERLKASVVYLSFGTPPGDRLIKEVHALAERLAATGRHLVLGGRHADACQPGKLSRAFVGRSLSELSAFAKGLVRPATPAVDVPDA